MNRALQIIGVVTLCLTSSFADPATISAMATAIGEVFLNGNALTRTGAVLDGDRLTTGPSAAIVLHLPGSSIHIGPSSSTRFRGTTLELLSGSTEVQGRESIAAGAYKISPAGESRFTVQHELTTIVLRLLRGSVELSRGHEVKMITNPGEYTLQDNAPAPAIKPHRITKALPIAAGAAAGTAVVISHWLTGKEAATSTSCVSGKSPTSCK